MIMTEHDIQLSTDGGDQEPVDQPATARERMAWMSRNSRTTLAALAAVGVAAVLATFSFSLYSSSSANPGNAVTTGIMQQDNTKDGAAIFSATDLVPGDTSSGTVTISNVGDVSGDFTLRASKLTDTSGPSGTPGQDLSKVLQLTIAEPSTGATVYDGTIAGFTSEDLGTWAKSATHTYRFTVLFPSTAGDEYQGAGTSVDFDWSATQS